MEYCFLNGQILPLTKAHLKLNDLGMLRGYGVFDYLRTYHGKPISLVDNIARFRRSARYLGLSIPYSDNQIKKAVTELIKKNKFSESQVRMVTTGGPSDDAFTPSKPTVYILVSRLSELPGEFYTNGVKLITHEYLRLVPEAKTLNYITAVKLLPQRKKLGAFEVLYTYQGKVLEGTTSNFHLIKNKTLITAKKDILNGLTRETVLQLASGIMRVVERDIGVNELKEADEAFITAANKKVLPVVKVDELTIGNGKVGSYIKQLIQLFEKYTQKATL